MIRRTLLGRFGLLLIVLAIIGFVILTGYRLGLSEILIVGAVVALILLADGLRFVIAQIIKGYRGELPPSTGARKR